MQRLPILLACLALSSAAQAADTTEAWPEVSLFYGLGPRARAYLDASYADGKESDTLSRDLSLFLDVPLKPVLRKDLLSDDWQRSKYLWARIGYTHVDKTADGTQGVPEDRGVVALYGKVTLPAGIWLESRARADMRWIGDDYSNRYRIRLEATREFTTRRRTVVPYLNYEWFYDTRYDGWARTLWMAGAEVTVNEHFRYEVYAAGQQDRHPSDESVAAFGFVAKWYY